MKKILTILCMMFFVVVLFGCNNDQKKDDKDYFYVKITDIDREVIGDKKIEVGKYDNLFQAIDGEFAVVASDNGDGTHWIKSINHSIKDNNWSLMLFVDGVESWDSADVIKPEVGKTYEFKNTCWAAIDYGYGTTMDETDILLDEAIYHYMKTKLKSNVESLVSFEGSSLWEMLTIELFKRYSYDSSLITFNYKEELKSSIANVDLTKLSSSNIGKYYIHARVLDNVSSSFENYYQNQLDALTTYNGFSTPFVIFPASFLGLKSSGLDLMVNEDLLTLTELGPDTNLWQIAVQSLFKDLTSIDYKTFVKEWGSNCSNCLVLLGAASLGINIRNTAEFGTFGDKKLDYLAYLFDNYYDANTKIMKVNTTDTSYSMSSNQVYAYLLAYKCFRDSYSSANIFGVKIINK